MQFSGDLVSLTDYR